MTTLTHFISLHWTSVRSPSLIRCLNIDRHSDAWRAQILERNFSKQCRIINVGRTLYPKLNLHPAPNTKRVSSQLTKMSWLQRIKCTDLMVGIECVCLHNCLRNGSARNESIFNTPKTGGRLKKSSWVEMKSKVYSHRSRHWWRHWRLNWCEIIYFTELEFQLYIISFAFRIHLKC